MLMRTPAGELALELPLPGLYNVYNALAAVAAALELGVEAPRIAAALAGMRAAFGRVETIDVAGKLLSILLIKNPAGANEVLRTLRLEAGEDGLDLWIALNDGIADGRDVSWVWDADFELLDGAVRRVVCTGTRAAEMAVRLKYAGWPVERIAVEPGIEASLDARARRTRRGASSPCPPTRRCWSCASCSPIAALPRSSGDERGDLARSRVRRLHRRPAALGGAGRAYGAEEPIMELGCGTGRVTLHLARRGAYLVIGLDRDPALVEAVWERAARELAGDASSRDVREFSFATQFRLVLAPMQLIQLLAGSEERISCLGCTLDNMLPGGKAALAIVEEHAGCARGCDAAAAGRAPDRRLDLLEPAAGAAVVEGKIVLRRLRQTVDPDGEMSEEMSEVELCLLSAEALEEEARSVGFKPIGRRQIPATDAHVGSTVVLLEKGA